MRTIHLCQFRFRTVNIRRVGHVVDGGTSLSGLTDEQEIDGGGYFQGDFSNGSTNTKTAGNAWRVLSDADAGEPFNVVLCAERRFQPVGPSILVPHSDDTSFDDDSEYVSGGADYATTADAALRATSLSMSGTSEKPIIGGELFSIQHPTWGWRVYRIRSVDGANISFRPPLREAVPAGTQLEFDTPRCQMVVQGTPDNTTDTGRSTTCAISFVEDMRPPSS